MILLFLISLGILIFLIGIWKRKAIYGKVFIGVGVLLIGIFFFGPFGIFYSCEKYSNDLKNVLQKINKPCENSDDCKLISYYPCEPYCINKDVDLSAFYSLKKKRPWSCPLDMCIAPEVKWECTCENNTCTVKEKEVAEEKIRETANWKTYRNENFGIEFKYPPNWVILKESDILVSLQRIDKPSQTISILKSSGPPPETMGYKLIESKPISVDKLKLSRELFQGEGKFENISKNDYYVRVFISEKTIFYQGGFKGEDLEEFLSLFDQILSTFKFVEET
jgi:hypothetical protein